MDATMSIEDFRALVRRAGLPMTDEQIEELHRVNWPHFEKMIARIHGDGLDPFLEPAHIFAPEARK
jgi:hypothetical protein